MEDIILSVAPANNWDKKRSPSHTPQEVIKEALRCTEEGASVIHIHPHETCLKELKAMRSLEETFQGIYDNTDLIIEAGTYTKPELSLDERLLPTTLEGTVFATLNLASLDMNQIQICLNRMDQYRVKPSLEIYDTGQLIFARHLIDQGLLDPPYIFTFKFNVQWGMVFSPEQLTCLIKLLPEESYWGAVIAGSRDFTEYLSAAEQGADFLRIGYEYSPLMGGPDIFSNAQLIGRLRKELEQNGRNAMPPYEAGRKLLMTG
jgi:3-keto-5-aminohexanoate cleavage enzyme